MSPNMLVSMTSTCDGHQRQCSECVVNVLMFQADRGIGRPRLSAITVCATVRPARTCALSRSHTSATDSPPAHIRNVANRSHFLTRRRLPYPKRVFAPLNRVPRSRNILPLGKFTDDFDVRSQDVLASRATTTKGSSTSPGREVQVQPPSLAQTLETALAPLPPDAISLRSTTAPEENRVGPLHASTWRGQRVSVTSRLRTTWGSSKSNC